MRPGRKSAKMGLDMGRAAHLAPAGSLLRCSLPMVPTGPAGCRSQLRHRRV